MDAINILNCLIGGGVLTLFVFIILLIIVKADDNMDNHQAWD